MIIKVEMLDLPAIVKVVDFQMMIINDLMNTAFQKVFDAGRGRFDSCFFRCPVAIK